MQINAKDLKVNAEYIRLRALSRLYHEYNSVKITVMGLDLTINLCERDIADPTRCVSSQDYNENMEIKKEAEAKKLQVLHNVTRLLRFLGMPEHTSVASLNIDIDDIENRLNNIIAESKTQFSVKDQYNIQRSKANAYNGSFKLDPGFKALIKKINEAEVLKKQAQEEVERCDAILAEDDIPYNEIPEYRADLNDAKAKLSQQVTYISELERKRGELLKQGGHPKPPFLACPHCGRSKQIDFQNQKQR